MKTFAWAALAAVLFGTAAHAQIAPSALPTAQFQTPATGDSSQAAATTNWASKADNITSGTLGAGVAVGPSKVTATGQTVARPLADVAAYPANVVGSGADTTGTNASATASAFSTITECNNTFAIPAGKYNMNPNVAPNIPTLPGDGSNNWSNGVAWHVAPNAIFSGAGQLWAGGGATPTNTALPYQGGSVISNDFMSIIYGSATNGRSLVAALARHVEAANTTPTVSIFGQIHGAAAGSSVFGGNFVAYAEGASSSAVAFEADGGVLGSGADLDSSGNQIANPAIVINNDCVGLGECLAGMQVQTNGGSSVYGRAFDEYGLYFRGIAGSGNFRTSLITASPAVFPDYLVDFNTSYARKGEWRSPSFFVAPAQTLSNSRVEIKGSTTTAPTITLQPLAIPLTAAFGRIIFTKNPAAGDTVTINGSTLSFIGSGSPTSSQVLVAATLQLTLVNLLNTLTASSDANLTPMTYTIARGTTLTMTDKTPGTAGNAIAYSVSSTAAAADSGTFLNGADAASVPSNGDLIVQGLGTGGVRLLGGDGSIKFRVNSNGIGFFGASLLTQQTLTGACGGNTGCQAIGALLANYGLAINNLTN